MAVQQLALYDRSTTRRAVPQQPRRTTAAPMCQACREREARYGFSDDRDDPLDRPNTLCFDCFRMEIDRRHGIAEQLARGWNATQTALPLDATLETLRRRRGRAQIAARRALDLR